MSWPVSDADLGKLGKTIVKDAKGVITGANVAFGELNLTAPAAKIVEALTVALQDANAAAITARKPAELILKVKIIPDATGGRQTTLEFDVATKTPRRQLPKGTFWMSDSFDLLRADPDQREMFADAGDGRPYTPPRAVGDG